jgi:transposase InsO family protein
MRRYFEKSDDVPREGAAVRFAFIRDRQGEFPVEVLRDVLGVSRSGYYAWRDRSSGPAATRGSRLVVEGLISTAKHELIHHESYTTREEARRSLFEYIEFSYDRRRLHSTFGYRSPAEYQLRSAF